METIIECKNRIAIKYGYKNWEDAYNLNGGNSFKEMIDEVTEEYANQFKQTERQQGDWQDKLQNCYTEIWKKMMYPISMRGKDKADDILKKEFPFLTCNSWEENHKP